MQYQWLSLLIETGSYAIVAILLKCLLQKQNEELTSFYLSGMLRILLDFLNTYSLFYGFILSLINL